MKQYVIVKSSRRGANRTYTGPTWRMAGLQPKPYYSSREEAERVADQLSLHNPVGFVVEEYLEADK